jgi:F-type H+-transporting ATPase subunit b
MLSSETSVGRCRRGGLIARLAAPAIVAASYLVLAAPLLAEEEAGAGGGGLFALNPGLVVWTWIVFLTLLVVLRKWAWGPILSALEARERRIQEALDGAARDREEARRLLEEQRRLLEESRNKAQHILADSRKAAERLRMEMLEEARKERQQIVERAREDILRERDEALEALRREVVDLSLAAAGRVLQKEVDEEENRRLVEAYLERLAVEAKAAGAD